MKKIITQEERVKLNKRNQLFMGIILMLLMIFSTIAFAFSNFERTNYQEKIKYNDMEFVKDSNGYWAFEINGNKFYSLYNPHEISSIKFSSDKKIEDYSNQPLYFVGEIGEGFSELYRVLSNYALRISNACLDKNCKENYPLKNCDSDNIIIIEEVKKDEEEIIINDKKCVFIKAKKENEGKYADAYLFSLLRIT
jgi:hypothetical protein